jgi:hypothetical protein
MIGLATNRLHRARIAWLGASNVIRVTCQYDHILVRKMGNGVVLLWAIKERQKYIGTHTE